MIDFKKGDQIIVKHVHWNPTIEGYTGTITKIPKRIMEDYNDIEVVLDTPTAHKKYYFNWKDLVLNNRKTELL
jgi:uncharacterized protein YkvS